MWEKKLEDVSVLIREGFSSSDKLSVDNSSTGLIGLMAVIGQLFDEGLLFSVVSYSRTMETVTSMEMTRQMCSSRAASYHMEAELVSAPSWLAVL